jgi:hypothetical protein
MSNSPNIRPAQILLTDQDRTLATEVAKRLAVAGRKVPGPTALYRAGLRLLAASSDTELAAVFDAVEERLTSEQIAERFSLWLDRLCDLVVEQGGVELEWACQRDRNAEGRGHFLHNLRFANASLMSDGRANLSGMEIDANPIPPGSPIPQARVMFPGGLAALVAADEEGAQLAARALVAWLLCDDDQLVDARRAIANHVAQPLR